MRNIMTTSDIILLLVAVCMAPVALTVGLILAAFIFSSVCWMAIKIIVKITD